MTQNLQRSDVETIKSSHLPNTCNHDFTEKTAHETFDEQNNKKKSDPMDV